MKFNKDVLAWWTISPIFALSILSAKFSWAEYFLNIFVIVLLFLFLASEIIKFLQNKNFKGIRLAIRVPYYGYLFGIVYLFVFIANINRRTNIELVIETCLLLLVFIDVPINYKNNSRIYIYEQGISLTDSNLFVNKIITYDKIKKLNFIEYEKGKFLLEIRMEKSFSSGIYKYKIKEKDRQKIILFIQDFIEKEKIAIIKEYKEDKLF